MKSNTLSREAELALYFAYNSFCFVHTMLSDSSGCGRIDTFGVLGHANAVKVMRITMTQEQSLQIIPQAFAHIPGALFVVEVNDIPDALDELIVKVYVSNDQLEAACGDIYGSIPRQAAISSGMSVEVALFSEMKSSHAGSAKQP
jgi:hypothetical protein